MAHPNRARIRVHNGARWLDENFPGWEARVNPKTLLLSDLSSCICGQVFSGYATSTCYIYSSGYIYAYNNLFAEANSWISALVPKDKYNRAQKVAVALGFSSPDGVLNDDTSRVGFAALEREWKRLLADRAAAAALRVELARERAGEGIF
jgi:hypothetical protein